MHIWMFLHEKNPYYIPPNNTKTIKMVYEKLYLFAAPLSWVSHLPGPHKPVLHDTPLWGTQIAGPRQGGFVPNSVLIALLQPSLHFHSLPHSPPQSLLPTPFYFPLLSPGPHTTKLASSFSGNRLPPALPASRQAIPACRWAPPNFSRSWSGRSSSALPQAGSVGSIGCGGSLSGCSIGKGDLQEGSQPSSGDGVSSRGTYSWFELFGKLAITLLRIFITCKWQLPHEASF